MIRTIYPWKFTNRVLQLKDVPYFELRLYKSKFGELRKFKFIWFTRNLIINLHSTLAKRLRRYFFTTKGGTNQNPYHQLFQDQGYLYRLPWNPSMRHSRVGTRKRIWKRNDNSSDNHKGTARLRYPKSGIPHTLRAKSIHQVLPMLFECASKNSFYICIVIPTRKDSSPGTRSRSPPWPSMIFRTEESPIPWSADVPFRERNVFPSCKARPS